MVTLLPMMKPNNSAREPHTATTPGTDEGLSHMDPDPSLQLLVAGDLNRQRSGSESSDCKYSNVILP